MLIEDGALVTFPPTSRRGFQMGSPTRENEDITLTYDGLPGDQVFVWGSLFTGCAFLPQRQGVFLLGFPLLLPFGLPLGVADALGELDVMFPLGDLGAGLEGVTVFFQVTFREAAGGPLLLGPMSVGVVLDRGF